MQMSALRGSRTVTSLRLCSRAPWTTSSSMAIRPSLPRLSRSNKCSCEVVARSDASSEGSREPWPGFRIARRASEARRTAIRSRSARRAAAAEDEAAEGEAEPERAEREGADRDRPCARSRGAASGRAPPPPARSAPRRAAACASRRRPGGRGRGRRRSRGTVRTCFECIASFGRDRLRDPHLRPPSRHARGTRARRRACDTLSRARSPSS